MFQNRPPNNGNWPKARCNSTYGGLGVAVAALFLATAPLAQQPDPVLTVTVDANAGNKPISPYIYGVMIGQLYDFDVDPSTTSPTQALLADLNATLNREGGDDAFSYNWQNDTDNHAFPNFVTYPEDSPATISGMADLFAGDTLAAKAQPIITIPDQDYIGALGGNGNCSFPLSEFPANDQYENDGACGDGIVANPPQNLGNPPNAAYIQDPEMDFGNDYTPNSTNIQAGWLQHLVQKFGGAANSGVKYYMLGNEPSASYITHRDVVQTGLPQATAKMEMEQYAGVISSADSSALIFGPEEAGWTSFFFSGADQYAYTQNPNGALPDYGSTNTYYMPWLLSNLATDDAQNHKKTIDIFSMHYYPDYPVFGADADTDVAPATVLDRNQATRSLWDTSYVDFAGLPNYEGTNGGAIVQLIPRMKNLVQSNYQGLKTAVTEYNFGGEKDISGAIAEADALGIFGANGLDYATAYFSTSPAALDTTAIYNGFKMYRNYDGNKSSFGDTSLSTTIASSIAQKTDVYNYQSAWSALRSSDGAMTIMVINKDSKPTPVSMSIVNFSGAANAHAWQLVAPGTGDKAITQIADVPVSNSAISATVPAQSITLFVVPKAAAGGGVPPPTGNLYPPASGSGGAVDLWLLLPLSFGWFGRRTLREVLMRR